MIQAGNRLYAAGNKGITAVQLPRQPGQKPRIAWKIPVEGQILRLLAASDRLFAVTQDGRIMAFAEKGSGKHWDIDHANLSKPAATDTLASQLVQVTEGAGGYALCFGVEEELLPALSRHLRVVGVDEDAQKVTRLRRKFDDAGLYGKQIALHVGDPASYKAPSYIAHLVVVGKDVAGKYTAEETLRELYRSVRPYGGGLWLPLPADQQDMVKQIIDSGKLPQARMKPFEAGLLIVRESALPDSGDWTHQYGDIANTLKSDDKRVKLPLGVLWFGGNSHVDVLPRHGNGPPEQVIGGRLIIQGLDNFSARDVYTGRVLWKAKFAPEELGTFGIYYDETLNPDPLSGKSQGHIAGARIRGTNFVATEEFVYIALGGKCRVLDAKTGEKVRDIPMPSVDGEQPRWGFIGVYEDLLLGGQGFADYRKGDEKLDKKFDHAASRAIVAFDRKSGQELWRVKARYGFAHNGIVAGNGRIHLLDLLAETQAAAAARRGQALPADQRLLTVDARTGRELWSTSKDIHGVWLSLSVPRDILLLSTDSQPHRWANLAGQVPWQGRAQGITAYRASDGTVLWRNNEFQYNGPIIIHNDTIFSNIKSNWREAAGYPGAINLLDGKQNYFTNPLTGDKEPWRITRNYGCNSVICSENLMTFRSGAAGYFDLESGVGTGSLGGFKSSCTANLVVAGGVLNAPDYTRACSCTFQNQTSLGLIHMPDVVMERWTTHYNPLQWSNSGYREKIGVSGPIQRLGINLGAPGDWMDSSGTLWLEYPLVQNYQGGDSYDVPIAMDGDPTDTYRRFVGAIDGEKPWVGCSFIRDLKHLFIDLKTAGRQRLYTVKLYFAELEDIDPKKIEAGQDRRFSVALQGKEVLADFNILKAAGGRNKTVVNSFKHVPVRDALMIKLYRHPQSQYPPVLNGVEVIAEESASVTQAD